jgi:hypothetical protein
VAEHGFAERRVLPMMEIRRLVRGALQLARDEPAVPRKNPGEPAGWFVEKPSGTEFIVAKSKR